MKDLDFPEEGNALEASKNIDLAIVAVLWGAGILQKSILARSCWCGGCGLRCVHARWTVGPPTRITLAKVQLRDSVSGETAGHPVFPILVVLLCPAQVLRGLVSNCPIGTNWSQERIRPYLCTSWIRPIRSDIT